MIRDTEMLQKLLIAELELIEKANNNLKFSYEKCQKINLSNEISQEELLVLDSCSARFIRLYEVFSNQLLRTVLQLVGEYKDTMIDNLNKAEKLRLISSANDINTIRILRNKIAHEYLQDEWQEIYREVLEYCIILFENIDLTKGYIANRHWIN